MTAKHQTITEACLHIAAGQLEKAKQCINQQYPFVPLTNAGRKYSEYQKTEVFLRDGFIDRYSGDKLVFPPVLRLLSKKMPDEFPYHPNWKMSECHLGYWQLQPTIDHLVPVSRGGVDDESNWICTSQLRNSAKSNWLLEELGWQLHQPGDIDDWDGLLQWFMQYAEGNDHILDDSRLRPWYHAARKAVRSL